MKLSVAKAVTSESAQDLKSAFVIILTIRKGIFHLFRAENLFQASLALALGLSDIIQQRNGGIRLDSIFIDEGFGSLDNDSLASAIETLNDLTGNGNRLVGIISHISELKNSIGNKIEVVGTKSGSSIKIITD